MAAMGSRTWTLGRILGLGLVVAACIALLVWKPKPEVPKRGAVVRPARIREATSASRLALRTYSGTVQAQDRVDLSFRVSGPLVQLPVKAGQEIAEGELLAQIDPRDYETALARIEGALAEAQARLKAMKAGEREEVILQRQNELAAAQAELENAQAELERYQTLLERGVVSQSEHDQVKLRRDTAQQAVGGAEQRLRQAREGARPEDIEAQEAQIRGLDAQRREAQNALSDTTLKAPFAGVVARTYVENFQDVRAKEPVLALQDISSVRIEADVPESLMALVRREHVEEMFVTLEALGDRRFPVALDRVETEADPRTQTYLVTVVMDAPTDVRVLPGMPATLHLSLKASFAGGGEGTIVDAGAVFARDGASWVWRVDPTKMTVSPVAVEVEELTGDQAVLTGGIEDGDLVVTAGVHLLEDGQQVRRLGDGE